MTLQTTGPISFSQLQGEFGGSAPISMSEYYRNGPYVPGSVGAVPASGQISVSQFYGTTKTNLNFPADWYDLIDTATFTTVASAINNNITAPVTQAITLRMIVDVYGAYDRTYLAIAALSNNSAVATVVWPNAATAGQKQVDFTVNPGEGIRFEGNISNGGGSDNASAGGLITIINVSTGAQIDTFNFDFWASPNGDAPGT